MMSYDELESAPSKRAHTEDDIDDVSNDIADADLIELDDSGMLTDQYVNPEI